MRTSIIIRWANKVPRREGRNEIVHEVDCFVAFTSIAGTAIPKDRTIGVDQTDFLLDKAKSNREGFPVFVADGLEGGEVTRLQDGFLRGGARLVECSDQARRSEDSRFLHRS